MIVNAWKEALGVAEIGLDENVFDLVRDVAHDATGAAGSTEAANSGERFRWSNPFEFHTVNALATHLAGNTTPPRTPDRTAPPGCAEAGRAGMKSSAIAVVGMAGRFPGARNIDEVSGGICATALSRFAN